MAERYEARRVTGGSMPTDCCEFGVVDLDIGQEICRAWTSDGARRIANALNGAEGRKLNIIGSCLRQDVEKSERR